jgi:hypothetical protein
LAFDRALAGLVRSLCEANASETERSCEPGWSVVLPVWEDVWAQRLAEIIRASGAVLLEGARIPDDLYDDVATALADAR